MFCFRFKINFCTDIVRKRILSNISRCIDSIIVGPNICQVTVHVHRVTTVSFNKHQSDNISQNPDPWCDDNLRIINRLFGYDLFIRAHRGACPITMSHSVSPGPKLLGYRTPVIRILVGLVWDNIDIAFPPLWDDWRLQNGPILGGRYRHISPRGLRIVIVSTEGAVHVSRLLAN